MQACARIINHSTHPGHSALRVIAPINEFSSPVIQVCQGCVQPECVQHCTQSALVAQPEGGVQFYPEKCTGCGNCQESCSVGVITMLQGDNTGRKPIICRHCGSCAPFCPQGIISMEVRQNS
ncbi:MAG: 4Fe-4S dicluster domain-containing protein [Carboxydocellales bacterium]